MVVELSKSRPRNEKRKRGKIKKEAAKNTAEVKRILKDGERYRKNPILYYREIIKEEKYRKIFDEKLKQKKYQQILLKSLVHGKLNKDLYHLAIKVAAKQPDIIRRSEELIKTNK